MDKKELRDFRILESYFHTINRTFGSIEQITKVYETLRFYAEWNISVFEAHYEGDKRLNKRAKDALKCVPNQV